MTLLDRIARQTGSGGVSIQGHSIESTFSLYFHGHITRTQFINFYDIPVGMESDFDQFLTKYDSFSPTGAGPLNQTRWVQDLDACIIGLQLEEGETGAGITRAQFNTFLGLTLDAT